MIWCNKNNHPAILTNACTFSLSMWLTVHITSFCLLFYQFFSSAFVSFVLHIALCDRCACWKHSRNKLDMTQHQSALMYCASAVCIPGDAEIAAERKQQRTGAECQPYAVAPSPYRCADRWEPSGWVSWDRRQCVSAPRWETWVQQNEIQPSRRWMTDLV